MKYVIAILIIIMLAVTACNGADNSGQQNSDQEADGDTANGNQNADSGTLNTDGGDEMKETVVLETSKGNIEIQLNKKAAPKTVENFIQYVKDGHYDGTIFHRVIETFMIQGGGFTPDGKQKAVRDPIKIESDNGLKNKRYSVAMARTADPNSATSQFFINTADNEFLNYGFRDEGYTVFGKVTVGTEVVDAIKVVETTTKQGMGDWPVEDVVITKAYMK